MTTTTTETFFRSHELEPLDIEHTTRETALDILDEPDNFPINDELKEKIVRDLIEKTYYEEIKSGLEGRTKWKTVGDVAEVVSHVLTGLSTIVSFSAGFFSFEGLPFIAGCLGTMALICLKFSSYAMHESRERTSGANKILEILGIKKIVDIATDPVNKDLSRKVNTQSEEKAEASVSLEKKDADNIADMAGSSEEHNSERIRDVLIV